MVAGEQFVMIAGIKKMLQLCAVSLALQQLLQIVRTRTKKMC